MELPFFNDLISFYQSFISFIESFLDRLFLNTGNDNIDIDNYIRSMGRLVIFFLGTTVSANIYLFNTQKSISFSSIFKKSRFWVFLSINVGLLIFILILGEIISHSKLIFDFQPDPTLLIKLLKMHFFLIIISFCFFVVTLYKFITSFIFEKQLKKAFAKVWRAANPSLFNLWKYERNKIIEKQQIDFRKKVEVFKFKHKWTFIILKNSMNIPGLTIFYRWSIYVYLYSGLVGKIFLMHFFEKDVINRRQTPISLGAAKKINDNLEILSENLAFLIASKSNNNVSKYINEWNNLFSQLSIMVYYTPESDQKSKFHSLQIFRTFMYQHSNLILLTTDFNYKEYHKDFIKTLFHSLTPEESHMEYFTLSKENLKLDDIYFDSVFNLLVGLIKNENFESIDLLHSRELNLEKLLTGQLAMSVLEDSGDDDSNYNLRQEKYVKLFTSLICKMVELDITDKITSTASILFSLDREDESFNDMIILSNNKKTIPENSNEDVKIYISEKTVRYLIYVIIKSNELEQYKVAGYLTKIISSNFNFDSLMALLMDTREQEDIGKQNAPYFKTTDLGIYTIEFNQLSYQYCFDKTVFLFLSQYMYKKEKLSISYHDKNILKQLDYAYILKKLEDAKSEFNMISLNSITAEVIMKELE